ncbi:ParA family protein [Acidomonas methanolica]|uniref:Cobyrinic acid a,c-diamide synthase n=1 Tax=Acidomonas methanolica NBRC 104435 TaxID=1231351 RepID=A0A023D5E3_ACIMT|nr:ParA family protein [Acidomonas methanolica]MBU2655106.1 ParA family protein [Acidomonas methanolica]TCS29515.1 chromosome partitioning related protein ParA [Acidomonas methanolica]GAJ29357.1 cobyrinic acid a,c-diamide synthase [Acidomonas methanolica NBRC 104435]GBQ48363.1 ATPase [Acidomonas methanolica]GEK99120.1 chromosome partitioning protein [Acidomonas methanolica NBRC 104435]
MHSICIVSTKGGVGKTTMAANLGGFAADAGLRVLLLDLDAQPTLSSYYPLGRRAAGGVYELLAHNECALEKLVSHTVIHGLDIVLSNDPNHQLDTLLLHAPDGRLRLRNLLPIFRPYYDLLLIDTQGARSVVLEMALLASDLAVSPVTPEILAARELRRGTLQLVADLAPFRRLGIEPPPLHLLINRVPAISTTARLVGEGLRLIFPDDPHAAIHLMDAEVPSIESIARAATQGLPAHRVEYRRPSGRLAPSALEVMREVATELCPQWQERFALVTGRAQGGSVDAERA